MVLEIFSNLSGPVISRFLRAILAHNYPVPKGDPRAGGPCGNALQVLLLFPARSFISKLMPTLLPLPAHFV